MIIKRADHEAMCLQFYTIILTSGFNSANNKNTLIFVDIANALRSMYLHIFAQYFDKSVMTKTVQDGTIFEKICLKV